MFSLVFAHSKKDITLIKFEGKREGVPSNPSANSLNVTVFEGKREGTPSNPAAKTTSIPRTRLVSHTSSKNHKKSCLSSDVDH